MEVAAPDGPSEESRGRHRAQAGSCGEAERFELVGVTSNSTQVLRLSKCAPDLEFGLDVSDHLVCELTGAGGAPEFGGPNAV